MKKVYTGWLENEDAEWRNDCNVSGVIHVNGMKEVPDDNLYSPQDILRIQYFWCDVDLTHQRIVNDKGDLQ